MNPKKYNKQSKKDQFLISKLWKYILDKISNISELDEKKGLIDRIAAMEIFPYTGADGEIYFSSLTVAGISWFYLREGEVRQERSSKNYRIIAANVWSRDIYNKIIGIFGPGANQIGYIQLFSNEIVIRAILDEMEKENDYTEKWWQSAQDILKLWNGQDPGTAYIKAAKNKSNDYFLFEADYCPSYVKEKLLAVKVYKDILQHPKSKVYFESITEMNRKDAMKLLHYFGVPNRFSNGGVLSRYLRRLYLGISRKVHFPVQDNKTEQDLCNIAHEILFGIIRIHDFEAFSHTLRDRELRSGIPILNVNNAFISLDYSLFFEENIREEHVNEQKNRENTRRLDHLRINSDRYLRSVRLFIGTDFENLNQSFSQYRLKNIRTTEPEFYEWAWQYTQNDRLSRNILTYFDNVQGYIPCEYNQLILDVIQRVGNNIEQQYSFNMRFTARQALETRIQINALMRNQRCEKICPIVVDMIEKINAREIKYQLMSVLTCNSEIRAQIENDIVWDRLYCASSSNLDNCYVNVYYQIDGEYHPQKILLISNAKDEFAKQILMQYISDTYDIQIDNIAVVNRDRRQDYLNLTYGIRQFLSEQIEITVDSEKVKQTMPLNDIEDYSTEINLWNQLRSSRDIILTGDKNDRNHLNISIFGWQEFLNEKYRGKCQICGAVTITDKKNNNRYYICSDRDNSFSGMAANMFELCPTCHGQMRYGRSKRDLRSITKLANQYISKISNQYMKSGENTSLISELSSNGSFSEGFSNPIVCTIYVDGKQRQIFFSWEHFLRIAFMFYEEDKDYTYTGEIGNLMQLLRMLSTEE